MIKTDKLPSGSYRARVFIGTDEKGNKKFESFVGPDKKIVEANAAQFQITMERDRSPDRCTLKKAVADYIASRDNILSPSTISVYRRHAESYMGNLANISINGLTSDHLQKHINSMAENFSYKTIKNFLGLILPAIKAKRPHSKFNVTLPEKVSKEMPCPTEDDLRKILVAAAGTEIYKAIVIAICTGDRRSQVCGLEYQDIDRHACTLTVSRALVYGEKNEVKEKRSKSRAGNRTIKVPSHLLDILGEGEPHEKIVKLSLASVSDQFRYLMQVLGMPYTFHSLRHFNASTMLALGIPDKYAMERGGWATNHIMKNNYQHTQDAKRAEVDNKVNNYLTGLLNNSQQTEKVLTTSNKDDRSQQYPPKASPFIVAGNSILN